MFCPALLIQRGNFTRFPRITTSQIARPLVARTPRQIMTSAVKQDARERERAEGKKEIQDEEEERWQSRLSDARRRRRDDSYRLPTTGKKRVLSPSAIFSISRRHFIRDQSFLSDDRECSGGRNFTSRRALDGRVPNVISAVLRRGLYLDPSYVTTLNAP